MISQISARWRNVERPAKDGRKARDSARTAGVSRVPGVEAGGRSAALSRRSPVSNGQFARYYEI